MKRLLLSPGFASALIAGAILVTSVVTGRCVESHTLRLERSRFERLATAETEKISHRMYLFVAMLRGVVGYLSHTEAMTTSAFSSYAAHLSVEGKIRGLRGIGFARWRSGAERSSRNVGHDGADVESWVRSDQEPSAPITFLYPLDSRNRAAIGFDMLSEPVRREALLKARDSGLVYLTGKVALDQDLPGLEAAGFLLLIPMYSRDDRGLTVAERREHLEGFSFSPFVAADYLSSILDSSAEPLLDFVIYDGSARSADALIYDSRITHSPLPRSFSPLFSTAVSLDMIGRDWTVLVSTRPAFERTISHSQSPVIISAGSAISLLVLILLWTRERARRTLAESESRFRTMADSVSVLIGICDLRGRGVYFNRPWLTFTRRTLAQELGTGWLDTVHPDDRKDLLREIATLSRLEPIETQLRLRRFDGEYRTMLVRAVPQLSASGKGEGFIGSLVDISELKAIEEERLGLLERERAARCEAERTNRMKDEFLANVSHELRTPLNAIMGWVKLIRRQGNSDEQLLNGLSVIERNARVQAQIIEDLLDMNRIISGKIRMQMSILNLNSVIAESVAAIGPQAEAKEITLGTVIDNDNPVFVRGDSARIQQSLWNLLSNALKFTPRGGRVDVTLEATEGEASVKVSDSGEGIDPTFIAHVFDRFRQADASITRKHGGLGLGLAISKHLIELHGGRVSAASDGIGRGSTFTISLPRVHEVQQLSSKISPQPDEAVEQSPDLSGFTALILDDQPDARELLRRVLEEHHAEVIVTGSATEALREIPRAHPHVLVSDIGMPGMDGYAFIRAVRDLGEREGGKTPAIAVTAFARERDQEMAFDAGYQGYLAKPLDPARLIAEIARLRREDQRRAA